MKLGHAVPIVVVVNCLVLAACGLVSENVPSLRTTGDMEVAEPATKPGDADAEDAALDEEAMVMAFVQCMRDEGIEFKDPQVDSDGNVRRPELVEGFTATRKKLAEPYAACSHRLEGLSFGRERQDVTQRVDQLVALATCLRDKGYDVDDFTAETLDQWGADFRVELPWGDPAAKEDYEECNGED